MGFGFGMGFDMFNVMFYLIFGIVIVMFVVTAVRGIGTWSKNNNSPRLTVEATVAAKRQNTDVHHYNNAGDATGAHGMHTSTSTTYYVTFQVASGDRMELRVSGQEYGMLAEGDFGELTFQGTRYLGFERRGSKAAYYDRSGDGSERQRTSWDPER